MLEFIKTMMSALKTYVDSKIVKSKANWNQNDPSADDYIKNRTHWEEEKEVVVVPSTDVTFEYGELDTSWSYICDGDEIIIDQEYTVNWDGVKYKCTGMDLDGAFIGNPAIWWYEEYADKDNGMPFCIYYYGTELWCGVFNPVSGADETHNVEVVASVVDIHPLDEKYLPDSVNEKMDKKNPTGTGSFSLNRQEDSEIGKYSVAIGGYTTASGNYSYAEGQLTTASGDTSHSEGVETTASGQCSHAEGYNTKASGEGSHAEGYKTKASNTDDATSSTTLTTKGYYAHAEGYGSVAYGAVSHAEGNGTKASGSYSHSEGKNTKASGDCSHAEGDGTIASGNYSHAEGSDTTVTSDTSITIKTSSTTTKGAYGHAEGYGTVVTGVASHAEGMGTKASGSYSHTEGNKTTASGNTSHAEGSSTTASGDYSHAEGQGTIASGHYSHTEGFFTAASGYRSHAEGTNTIASGQYQHVQGKWNINDSSSTYADIVGNGTSDTKRSNAYTLDWNGNGCFAGDVYVGGASMDKGNKVLSRKDIIKECNVNTIYDYNQLEEVLSASAITDLVNVYDNEIFDYGVILEDKTFLFDSNTCACATPKSYCKFIIGDSYKVIWDGVEYDNLVAICVDSEINGIGGVTEEGNTNDYSVYPFSMLTGYGNDIAVYAQTDGNHTFSLYHYVNGEIPETKKIKEEYLPNTNAGGSSTQTAIQLITWEADD